MVRGNCRGFKIFFNKKNVKEIPLSYSGKPVIVLFSFLLILQNKKKREVLLRYLLD